MREDGWAHTAARADAGQRLHLGQQRPGRLATVVTWLRDRLGRRRRVSQSEPTPPTPATLQPGRPSLLVTAGDPRRAAPTTNLIPRPPYRGRDAIRALRQIRDHNPDANLAAATAKRVALTPYRLHAWHVDHTGRTDRPHDQAREQLERFARQCFRSHEGGGIDALLAVALESLITDGAAAIELDVAPSLTDVTDIVLVDTELVDFEAIDEQITPVYRPPFATKGIPFNPQQFRYIGLDTTVERPHGRPWFLPALDTAQPQHEMRNILQKVVRNQGFGQITAAVEWDRVAEKIPPEVTTGGEMRDFMRRVLDSVKASFDDKKPDDVLVHYDFVKPDHLGAAHASQSLRPRELADVYDTDQAAAVKTPGSLLGRSTGQSLSTNADVHWVVYALALETLRRHAARLVEWALNQYLLIRGIQAEAVLEFEPIRKTDRVAESQALLNEHRAVRTALELRLITEEQGAAILGYPAPVASGRGVKANRTERRIDTQLERGEPLQVTAPSPAGAVELAQLAPLDHDDAAAITESWDHWATDNAPDYVGLLTAHATHRSNGTDRRPAPPDPIPLGWRFDARLQRYRHPPAHPGDPGAIVASATIDDLLEQRIAVRRTELDTATSQLLAGELPLREWQSHVAATLRAGHLEARMLAVGGRDRLTIADYAIVTARVAYDLQFLAQFAQAIARGELSEARIHQRIAYYAAANLRESYRLGLVTGHNDAGFRYQANVLEPTADHCDGCQTETQRGLHAIGSGVPLGHRDCGPFCQCHYEFWWDKDHRLPPRPPTRNGHVRQLELEALP